MHMHHQFTCHLLEESASLLGLEQWLNKAATELLSAHRSKITLWDHITAPAVTAATQMRFVSQTMSLQWVSFL